jgi:hypothetical protein
MPRMLLLILQSIQGRMPLPTAGTAYRIVGIPTPKLSLNEPMVYTAEETDELFSPTTPGDRVEMSWSTADIANVPPVPITPRKLALQVLCSFPQRIRLIL